MDKTIEIDGRLVTFRATAAIPRLYRLRFHRDIMQDMARMREEILKAQKEKKSVPVDILTLFENVAFLMAKHADPSLEANTVEEWLETFSSFSIYTVFPVISELWLENIRTLVEAKKKTRPIDRSMTTALFLLRAAQMGLSMSDLDLLTIGMVWDMMTEAANDHCTYEQLPTQDDFDSF